MPYESDASFLLRWKHFWRTKPGSRCVGCFKAHGRPSIGELRGVLGPYAEKSRISTLKEGKEMLRVSTVGDRRCSRHTHEAEDGDTGVAARLVEQGGSAFAGGYVLNGM